VTARKQVFVLINRYGNPVIVFASPIDALDHCAKIAMKPRVKGKRRPVYQVQAFDVRPVNAEHHKELVKMSDRLRHATRRTAVVKLPDRRSGAKVIRKARKGAKR